MPYTVKQAADKLNLHKSSVIERIHKGILKAKKIPITRYTYEIDDTSLLDNLSIKIKGRKRNIKSYAEERGINS